MDLNDKTITATLFAFDNDADGSLSPSEVSLAQMSFGIYLDDEERQKFDNQLGDGQMGYKEAMALIKGANKGHDPKKELEKLVTPFDIHNDGTISLSELVAVFNTLSTRVTGDTAASLASQFTNGDRLRYREFFHYLLE